MLGSTQPSNELERKLQLVLHAGLSISTISDLESIARAVTDVGLQLCGAQVGAFSYREIGASSEKYLHSLYSIDGKTCSTFSAPHDKNHFPLPFEGDSIIRSPDITKDSRYEPQDAALSKGQLPMRSYLAVPVKGQSGEVWGALIYGHEDADVFGQSEEDFVAIVAAQAAFAIENIRLRLQLKDRISDLQKIERSQSEASKPLGELAAIVESSDDAIISKDLNGIITSWNAAATRILGYTSEEMIGQSILKLIPESLHSDETTIISKIRAGERIEHFETVRLTKDGQLLDVSLTVSPVKDHTGTIIGASKILRDITDKRRLEASLLQAEKIAATGRMAATIAHEINNPLEAVVNLLYLLRPMITQPDGVEYLTAAESELSRVSHIAKQTLGYYREHASAVSSSVSELVGHALTIYGPRCAAAKIRVEKSLESSRKVVLRKGEIMQVISNLIANAIYSMPAGGTLRISVRDTSVPQPGVLLSVEDTGVGIPAGNLPKIFDAFFTTRKTIGTGIGLFIAKQFVEGHNGEIRASSEVHPDKHGTKIAVFLPMESAYHLTSETVH
jgi:PAS domain S-box-containing protein